MKLTTIVVPDPGPGEALVRVQACGVCHTDLHYREGGIGDDYPYLLGHEAAGVVEAVGDGVTAIAPGDFVILNWRAVCGECRACKRGRPWYCFNTHNARQKMTLTDGTVLSPALGIGAFAEKTLVAAGQCTKVNPAARPEVAGLLGCGVMAGLGAAINTAPVTRGDSVAVIGCGGVGDAAVLGAVLNGARTIIAVDIDPRKLEWARQFGATHVINSRETDPVEGIRALTGGNGADVVIEAIGRPETYQQAFYARDLAGTVVAGRRAHPGDADRAPAAGRVRPRRGAQVVLVRRLPAGAGLPGPDRPVPARDRLPLDKFVSERILLDEVEEAFAKMERGEVLRSVVNLCMTARIEKVVTSGTFSLDGQDFAVDNNVWLLGDDQEVVVIDAAHDPQAILAAVGGRRLSAVVCTHGHNDHINAAPRVAEAKGAPVLLHPADQVLWRMVYPGQLPDGDLADEQVMEIAATPLRVLHTPGHSPGSVCLYAPELRVVFSGDTLFHGGPGATGRSYSDHGAIIRSIQDRLMTLPPETVVHTGHGEDTTIGAESGSLAR